MHDTDEPGEGHNSIPKGWMLFFFGVIIWLVWYIVSFTPAISGWSFYKDFEKEMAKAAPAASESAATPDKYSGDSKAIAEGKEIYGTNCAACHMADASGGIGPNLTGTLKYGSTRSDLYESVANGRPNGMPPFMQQLGKDRIYKVTAFLETLKK
ncbi:MAG: c-type cytochrome [Chlorobiaceae bacterium]|jgi:cytochrome c oxidase cbb3-type subunit III|nr:c-type cytochrome [Chlorobiaceae bacterium]